MNIYISHKSRKDECIKFKEYWEEKWFPQIKKLLYDFCKEMDGEIINADLAERIAEDYVISDCQFAPVSDSLYKESLVTIKKAGVFWHNHIWDNIRISSLSELIQFFDDNEHKENYVLEDENGKIYFLSELIDEIAKYN
ncbi:MAG: hypothetical protein Q4F76_05470 [Lachnospiraceae bacterium]|nr:hypothetical protein [Lachnospiraceae bacterium]